MTMITLNGISEPGYTPFDNLADEEQKVVEIIKSLLKKNGFPNNDLLYRYTSSYLAIESFKTHPFARIKLSGKTKYIELSCGDPKTGKNMLRIDIMDVQEIADFEKEIITAFRFCDPKYIIRYYVKLKSENNISPQLIDFFTSLECNRPDTIIEPNEMCLKFFESLLNEMDNLNLDWRKTKKYMMADGSIKFCGGIAKFGKKVLVLGILWVSRYLRLQQ